MAHTHSFDAIFLDRFAFNFVDTTLNFLIQGVGGRKFVGINPRFEKIQIDSPTALVA
jgi:hypothetical protein